MLKQILFPFCILTCSTGCALSLRCERGQRVPRASGKAVCAWALAVAVDVVKRGYRKSEVLGLDLSRNAN
jgi:hypothetical protein